MRSETTNCLALALLFVCASLGFSHSSTTLQDVNVTGAWDITVESSQGAATPSVNLRQDGERITGTYKGRLGESKLEGTIRGNEIKFVVNLTFQDQAITVTYSGTVDKDAMKGTVQFGDRGSSNWTAKRKQE